MTSRFRSIRTKIALLLFVPLVSLMGLWAFATAITLDDGVQLMQARTLDGRLVKPAQRVIVAVQHERRMSMTFLGATGMDRSGMDAQRRQTDQVRRDYLAGAEGSALRDIVGPDMERRIDTVETRLVELDAVRRLVDQRAIPRGTVLNSYSRIVESILELYKGVSPPHPQIARDMANITRLGLARELLTREDALVAGVVSAGRWDVGELDALKQLNGARRVVYADTVPALPPADRERYRQLANGPQFQRFERLEQALLIADPRRRPPLDLGTWHTVSEAVIGLWSEAEDRSRADTSERAQDVATGVFVRIAAAGGLGLLAVAGSTLVAWRLARRLIRESRSVAAAVGDFSNSYLPALAESVRSGERIDPDAALPTLDLRVTEIRRISESFDTTARAVIEATSREIAARRGINEVFVTLARRSQVLLHRQLGLLDELERRTEDPAELADLFRLDHLATRMRRHAEGLVILAGRTAGRTWRQPVPMIDVVRGAIAEVEDYPRVGVLPMPGVALAGTAVADTIHLLAELIENATMFSPPDSAVQITGQQVAKGFVIEIEDRGLGLKPETLTALNRRLSSSPDFDPSKLGRLGLFVVARLAERHEIQVALRPSPYGGTSAVVLLPTPLIMELPPEPPAAAPRPAPEPLPEPALAWSAPAPTEALMDDTQRPGAPPELPRRRRRVQANETAPEGLPQRRKQGSLNAAGAAVPAEAAEAAADGARSADAVREKMAAMQRGWQRGRAAADDAPAAPEQEESE
jgi:signal transduction histidine kinase